MQYLCTIKLKNKTIIAKRENENEELRNSYLEEIEDVMSNITDIDDAEEKLETLGEMKFRDEKIDDGCDDDDEDEYVMMRSYNLIINGYDFYMRIYYGNNSGTIGYYDID